MNPDDLDVRLLLAAVDRRPRDPELIGDRARAVGRRFMSADEDDGPGTGGVVAAFAATASLWCVGAATDLALSRARSDLARLAVSR